MNFQVYSKGKKVSAQRGIDGLGELEKGVFESLRAYHGKIFRLEEHLERLQDSARSIDLCLPQSPAQFKLELTAALKAYLKEFPSSSRHEAVSLRLTVWENQVLVFAGKRTLSNKIHEKGAVLRTTAFRHSSTHASAPEAKTNAYQNAVLALFDPEPKPFERLFLDAEGFVSEVSVGNIFMVKKGMLLTPPARGILNGVTRRFVLECARSAGIDAMERTLTRHDIYNADEVFLTNTSWEILPVRELDGRSIGKAVPGSFTRNIHRVFKKRIQIECRRSSSAAR